MGKAQRFDPEYIKEQFAKEGCKLITEYNNNNQKLYFVNKEGYVDHTYWSSWSRGYRPNRILIEKVRNELAAEGYTLLSKKISSGIAFECLCPKGHKWVTNWGRWKHQGTRCPECSGRHRVVTIEYIEEALKREGYELVDIEYASGKSVITYKCPQGHIRTIKWISWTIGGRCKVCSGCEKKTTKEVREAFEAEGFTLLSPEYKNAFTKLDYACQEGHFQSASWNTWQQGHKCPTCTWNRIAEERRIYNNEKLGEWINYKHQVTLITNKNYRDYHYTINIDNLQRGNAIHLDHIYSIHSGFTNYILPYVIANPLNLKLIPARDNIIKSKTSYITQEELYRRYNYFVNYMS